jgi:S-adenosylhomocysteine hydrolase
MTLEAKIFKTFLNRLPVSGYYFLFVFHLSKNNETYLESWVKNSQTIAVISIPYSEQKQVKDKIEKYTTVYSPELDKIPELLKAICDKNRDKKIILIEIGGYSATLLDKLSNVVLVVEDTMRGHKNFEENVGHVICPVISIARTKVKNVENIKVGEVFAKSSLLLCKSFNIRKPQILLLSYGNIGKHVASELHKKKVPFMVYDSDEAKRESALHDGYTVMDKARALSQADVVIGCTGNKSLSLEDISHLKDNCLLISGSSKQVEFPYRELSSYIVSSNVDLPIEKIDYRGKILYIAYKGQPINFYYDLSLGKVFAVPMSALVQSVVYGLSGKSGRGLHNLPMDQQKIVADAFPKDIISL